ncbi:helix-turn-helix domain-containing protein [Sphingobacterium sp. HMA12]|uniref:helix-turn-helix domain-containing protein n=1 Tax=Sphingobacterium sp. HMA12 TaxID=2050894 RepID=UPI000CEA5D37|nr:helix-turn-helix domain-containing protein [Sphingobacterium sp. HMA12]
MDKEKQTFDLARIRLEKGLTQQELAELSGLTSRTIQRIEKGEVIPYGDSVRKLAQALELSVAELYSSSRDTQTLEPAETIPTFENSEMKEVTTIAETRILSFFHFIPLAGVIFPLSNLLLPLLLWINYRDRNSLYDYHGRLSLNFQLTMSLLLLLLIVLLVFYFPVGFALFILIYLYTFVSCIVNGIRALNNQIPRYFIAIPFLKIPTC